MFNSSSVVEKKHVYIEVELAEALEKSTSFEQRRKIIDELIESKKGHFKQEILQLDEDLALFTGAIIKFKDNLDNVISKQEKEIDSLYDRSCEVHTAVGKRAKDITAQLSPITDIIDEVEGRLNKVIDLCSTFPIYRVEEFIKLVDMVNNLGTKRFEVLTKLMEVNK